ncbi:bifunctional DNA primase/polymerase [Mycobacterium sp. MAA66]|uniref:bifunctional DNA primase/polymerase n=1 Tax=Mycobacterium sp. MAA66 TaxID=3156297 RepID=UPI003513610B
MEEASISGDPMLVLTALVDSGFEPADHGYCAGICYDDEGQTWALYEGMRVEHFVRLGQSARQRGWGIQPIGRIDPHRPNDLPGKVPWMAGLSGRNGRDATEDEIADMPAKIINRLLMGERGVLNLGARVPKGVIGIDIDQYGSKCGLATIAEHVARLGPLPATYLTTARSYSQGSGIRLFAVPDGWEGPGVLGDGVELIQRHHRYLAAPGSVHHTGKRYRLHHEDTGEQRLKPVLPPRRAIPPLPESWLAGLYREPRRRGAPASADDVMAFAHEYTQNREPESLEPTVRAVRRATGAGQTRPAVHRALWIAARKARAGCYSWADALAAIREAAEVTYAERGGQLDDYDFARSVEHAVAEALDMHDSELRAWSPIDLNGWGARLPASEWGGWR